MSKLIIRQMEEKDIPQVYAIEEETFSMPWSRKAFEESISYYHTLFLVAELEGEIAGYCGCYQSLEEAEITNVAVKRQLRGHGIGRRLLEELMRIGKERGRYVSATRRQYIYMKSLDLPPLAFAKIFMKSQRKTQ